MCKLSLHATGFCIIFEYRSIVPTALPILRGVMIYAGIIFYIQKHILMSTTSRLAMALGLFVCTFVTAFAQSVYLDLPQPSSKAFVSERIGLTTVSVEYSRPAVRGREGKIWGVLVPYGQVWRAGANFNTIITFEHDAKINGQPIAAGSYGLHMIPLEKGEWRIIFSKDHTAWGSYFYQSTDDALRVSAVPEACSMQEFLEYHMTPLTDNSARVEMSWEKIKVGFTVEVDLTSITLASIRKQLRGLQGFTWQAYNDAAQWCLAHNVNLDEALQWADISISGDPSFSQATYANLRTKAQILSKLGDNAGAEKTMDQALQLAGMNDMHFYARSLLDEGKTERAMQVFRMNRERHPDDKFTTLIGLARGYAALGNYKEAAKYYLQAAPNAPQGQQEIYEDLAKQMQEKAKGKK